MKKILVLTDFSSNALHAAEWGVMLGKKLQTSILLFHSYLNHPVMAYVDTAGPWITTDFLPCKIETDKKLSHLADYLRPLADDLSVAEYKPAIIYKCGEGSLGDGIDTITNKENVELIVMGSRSGNALDHMLNGNDVNAVIDEANYPVIIVQPGSELNGLNKIVFATDFEMTDIQAADTLSKLAGLFNCSLDIVHISVFGKKNGPKTNRQVAFKKHLARFKNSNIAYTEIHGKEIANRLNKYCDEAAASLLAMTHRQHSFFKMLVTPSTVKNMLVRQHLPLMVFPSIQTKTY